MTEVHLDAAREGPDDILASASPYFLSSVDGALFIGLRSIDLTGYSRFPSSFPVSFPCFL